MQQSSELDRPAPAVSREQVLEQVERIAASSSLRASPALQRLLRYVVGKTLEGETGDLKEYSVGLAVFQRRSDFDPSTDSIVRAQATQLRKRLTAYYEGRGRGRSRQN